MAKLEKQGFRFANWFAAEPDAEGVGDEQTAVMVKRGKHGRTEYRQVEPDGTVN